MPSVSFHSLSGVECVGIHTVLFILFYGLPDLLLVNELDYYFHPFRPLHLWTLNVTEPQTYNNMDYAEDQLRSLSQGGLPLEDFVDKFLELCHQVHWDE